MLDYDPLPLNPTSTNMGVSNNRLSRIHNQLLDDLSKLVQEQDSIPANIVQSLIRMYKIPDPVCFKCKSCGGNGVLETWKEL